jgi:crossover junction endodeoxyribonuclease RuvC
MIALGIDPGTRRVGFGVVEKKFGNVRLVDAGILKITTVDDIGALCDVKRGMDRLFKKYKPDIVGIERLYFAKNQKTALAVAQARGIILLSSSENGIFIKEYTPNEIKLGVTGYGSADKKAVFKMVRLTLGEHNLKIIDDASDALAIAIMASGERV